VQSNYKINANFIEPIKGLTIKAANGSLMVPKGKTLMNLKIGSLHTNYPAIVMDNINYDVILGNDFLAAFNTKINYEGPTVTFNELPSVQLDISNQNATSYGVRIEKETWEEEPRTDTDSSNEEEQTSKQKFKFKLITKTSVNPKSTCLATITPTSETDVLEGQLYLIEPLERLLSQYGIILGPGLIVLDKSLQAVVSISNPENYEMVLPRGITLAEGELTLLVPEEAAQLNECNLDEQVHAQQPRPLTPEQLASLKVNPELTTVQRQQMLNLLSEFGDIFAFEMSELGRCDVDKFRIDTGDSRPIHSSPYRNSPKEKEEIRRQVQEMLAAGIIQHSASPWSSPVLLVPKANGTMRFTIDYRKLNKVTKRDQYPMVRVDDLLDGLQSSKIFTTIDLYAGYHQVEVHEADREKTAFVTSDGLYEYTRLSFGLANAPAFFQRVMNACMAGLAWSTVLIYLDDLIVPGSSFEDHLLKLRRVFYRVRKHGLTLQPPKCYFGYYEVKVLGHIVSADGVKTDPEKVKAVQAIPSPRNAGQARRFIGMASYYRRFIKDFSIIARPLIDLWKKNVPFSWGEDEQVAFDKLKEALINSPCLAHHDPSLLQIIHADASKFGLGAVLVQVENGFERPVAYASRSYTDPETRYSVSEKECLALCFAVRKFRPYVHGKPFTFKSDHHSLCHLKTVKDPNNRLARFAIKLQPFEYTVAYKSGALHYDADCLSRTPTSTATQEDEDFDNSIPMTEISFGTLDPSEIKDMQASDAFVRIILEKLTQGGHNQRERKKLGNFKTHDGVLFRQTPTDDVPRLVVPVAMRDFILTEYHDNPLAGHLGFLRTFQKINSRYWWPKMSSTILGHTISCPDCQARKGVTQATPGKIQSIKTFGLFQRIGIDLMGPFPQSQSGNKYLVVATEYLTKYVFARPIPSKTSEEVAKFFLEEIICRIGSPQYVLSDRGKEFMSCVLLNLLKLIGSVKQTTTAYHPNTNGLTERTNKSLATMISMYVSTDRKHADWDKFIPHLVFGYNTSQHSTTRFTPFQLMYGVEARFPVDASLLPINPKERSEELLRLVEVRDLALARNVQRQATDKARIDPKRREVTYNVGDLVRVFYPTRKVGLSEKLLMRWFGPYKVIEKLSPVTYRVSLHAPPDGKVPRIDTVNVQRMKPHFDRESDSDNESPDEAEEHQEPPGVPTTDQTQEDPPLHPQDEPRLETASVPSPTVADLSQDNSAADGAGHPVEDDTLAQPQIVPRRRGRPKKSVTFAQPTVKAPLVSTHNMRTRAKAKDSDPLSSHDNPTI
jgi:hypothetical protein